MLHLMLLNSAEDDNKILKKKENSELKSQMKNVDKLEKDLEYYKTEADHLSDRYWDFLNLVIARLDQRKTREDAIVETAILKKWWNCTMYNFDDNTKRLIGKSISHMQNTINRIIYQKDGLLVKIRELNKIIDNLKSENPRVEHEHDESLKAKFDDLVEQFDKLTQENLELRNKNVELKLANDDLIDENGWLNTKIGIQNVTLDATEFS